MEIRNLNEILTFSETGITKKVVFNTKEVLCFVLNLLPGQSVPAHRHENAVLIGSVLAGSCLVAINQDQYELAQGHALMVKGEDDFAIPKVLCNLSLCVTLSPNPTDPAYSKEYN